MLKQIWSLTRKELKIWLQYPGQAAVLFLVPFLFMWIMGTVFGGGSLPRVAIFVVNEDSGPRGAEVLKTLQENPNLEVTILSARIDADHRIGVGERMAAVVIPAGFSDAVLKETGGKIDLIIDPAQSEKASIVRGLLTSALAPILVDAEVSRGVTQSLKTLPAGVVSGVNGVDQTGLMKFLTAALKGVVSSQVQDAINHPLVQVQLSAAGEGKLRNRIPTLMESLVPGYMLMFLFFLVSAMAASIVEEREIGTMRRLLIMPLPRAVILFGKMLPYFLIALIQMTALLFVSRLVFGISLGNSPLGLVLIIFVVSLAVVALGVLIAAFARTEGQADGMTTLLVLVMAIASGSMFPSIFIPGVQFITPHYWAIRAIQNIITRGQGVESILLPAGVLLGMAVVFFGIGAARFRFE
jgi:ABC-2 type transport system permease protein